MKKGGAIKGTVLDYGSGRGADARHLKATEYDPYYSPKKPFGKFDTVLCTYVLCVVAPRRRKRIFDEVMRYTHKEKGVAYFTVRADVDKKIVSSRGTTQYKARLNNFVYYKTSGYIIYAVTWGDHNV